MKPYSKNDAVGWHSLSTDEKVGSIVLCVTILLLSGGMIVSCLVYHERILNYLATAENVGSIIFGIALIIVVVGGVLFWLVKGPGTYGERSGKLGWALLIIYAVASLWTSVYEEKIKRKNR